MSRSSSSSRTRTPVPERRRVRFSSRNPLSRFPRGTLRVRSSSSTSTRFAPTTWAPTDTAPRRRRGSITSFTTACAPRSASRPRTGRFRRMPRCSRRLRSPATTRAATRWLLADSFETLAESLAEAGYRTLAVTGGGLVHPSFGLAQGFDRYFGVERIGRRCRSAVARSAAGASERTRLSLLPHLPGARVRRGRRCGPGSVRRTRGAGPRLALRSSRIRPPARQLTRLPRVGAQPLRRGAAQCRPCLRSPGRRPPAGGPAFPDSDPLHGRPRRGSLRPAGRRSAASPWGTELPTSSTRSFSCLSRSGYPGCRKRRA